ncbi:oxidoreductin [Niveomyces insectorum RCEF 264]|uniref:Oxidoreductin n=1 Tax=Niveomyces insectorum RCEF 264 TaxID=1081102 RepID=A0A167N7Q0_9HYPO|nr:oxidoreductin [Niveomyces insectorum RCEF 264]
MKPASKLFYLNVFALLAPPGRCQESSQDVCVISPKAIVSDACASYSTLEKLNSQIGPALSDLTKTTDFFSYYRVNLFHKKCPFWKEENGMCGNIACAVQTLENEDDIPKVWRASELGKLQGPSAKHPGKSTQRERPRRPLQGRLGEHVGESCVVEYDDECDDRDYCVPEDESAASKGDYVSLVQNPERFTGYAGDGAQQVWEAIYRENCFQKSSFPKSAQLGYSAGPQNPAALDLRSVLEAAGRKHVLEQQRQHDPNTPFVANTGLEAEDECIEKRVFYRLMSGMHASISTHLCWEFLNQTTGEWTPNVNCYVNRLHKFPERISNLYFNYALLTRAVAKLGPHLQRYIFCTGEPEQDDATRARVLAVTETAASVPQIFDESLMFKNGEGPSLKEDFRNRFRNVSRLMDCVGCDKCRLWGKLQTAGYGTALKVLFEFDNEGAIPQLQRTELVSLFNTYARLSSSLNAITKFRLMVAADEDIVAAAEVGNSGKPVQALPDRVRKPHNVVVPPGSVKADDAHMGEDAFGQQHEPTIREMFDEELGRVMYAFKIVIVRWVTFPKTL